MSSILSKIGKAAQVIKTDGLWRGSRRILGNYSKILRRVDAGDILFIGGFGDSALYRCDHVAEELALRGFKSAVTVYDNPFLAGYADNFKIFVFHRAIFTARIAKFIDTLKKRQKEIVFEADDLLFDPLYFAQSDYSRHINALEKKFFEKGLGSEILNDPYVKTCTTTTSYLAEKLAERGKKVFIVSNKLSNKDLEIVRSITSRDSTKLSENIKIGYFSGTRSHDRDFATVTQPLLEIMKKYPQTELVLAGPLEIDEKFQEFSNRIKRLPYASRARHFANIASVHINLAPLEIGNPFCEAKSELKFFEAGILKIPTVAAKNRTFSEAIVDGESGFLASGEKEWFEKIEKLINSDLLRKSMGERAKQKTLADYTTQNSHANEYYDYLKSKLRSWQKLK